MTDRWRKVESVFHATRELPEGDRARFLEQACGGDDSLRSEIESLLAQPVSGPGPFAETRLALDQPTANESISTSPIGQRFGAFHVTALLGAGGMGEVYRARDTKLGRDVALKIMPRAMAGDPDRLARFEREARVLASLNHPNIATIFGVAEAAGTSAIVMELVEGDTLAAALESGRLTPLDQVLALMRQLADALGAAHQRGIVHRDLKPANIVVSRGRLKVLDFGLARIVEADNDGAQDSPTITAAQTRTGVIVGTPAYMSPEQARAQPVDKRTDIWAFGCILFELLTARRAFAAATVSDTIAAVLEREPDWQRLPSATPAALHRLLRRCLRKDATQRLQDIMDAHFELEEALSPAREAVPAEPKVRRQRPLLWIAVVTSVLAIGLASSLWRSRQADNGSSVPTAGPMTRITSDSGLTTMPNISADGRLIVFASDRAGGENLDIWLQQTSGGGPPQQLTKDPADDLAPDLAFDGSYVAFRSERNGGGVFRVPTLGGDARLIAPGGRGPKVSPDGQSIAFWTGNWLAARAVTTTRQTYVIPAGGGGEARPIASELASAGDPVWSPDGRALLVLGRRATSGPESDSDWWWVSRDGGPATKSGAYERMRAVGILTPRPGGSDFPYPATWTEDGVFFAAATGSGDTQNIWILPIDAETGRAVGDPRPLITGPAETQWPSISRDGRLVFADVLERPRLLGLPIDANAGRPAGPLKLLRTDAARVSTRATATLDGRFMAFGVMGYPGGEVRRRDLQTGDERQLAAIPNGSLNPLISPTGQFVAYTAVSEELGASAGTGTGYVMAAEAGAPRQICEACDVIAFVGNQEVLIQTRAPASVFWLLDLQTRQRVRLLAGGVSDPRISWDQRWIAFLEGNAINITPFGRRELKPEHGRTSIARRDSNADRVTGWSPDSSLLYLLLERDGFRCLYAVKIDQQSGRPQGEIFPVHHFHDARWRWGSTSRASAVVTGLFIAGQYEWSGNLWMTSLIKPPRP